MGRHKTRREQVFANKHHAYNQNGLMKKYKTYAVIGSVGLTIVLIIYFSSSVPDFDDTLHEKENNNWHLMKDTWSVLPLSDRQYSLVKESVKLERLKNEYLRYLLVVRPSGSAKIIEVRNFIKRTMSDFGWAVEEDIFRAKPPDPYPKTEFSNVIATLNPKAKRRLVLACHYDSKIEPKGFLGATDSAVPCAMMMEIAKALEDFLPSISRDLDITLQYIFFDGEEAFKKWSSTDSLYGSRHLATRWKKETFPLNSNSDKNVLHSIDLLVLLDLLGAPNPTFYDMTFVRTRHYKELIRIEKRLKDGLNYFYSRPSNAFIDDDHVPFMRQNVPVLHLLPYPFPRQWHEMSDNEENLDSDSILRLTRIVAVFVCEYLHLQPKTF